MVSVLYCCPVYVQIRHVPSPSIVSNERHGLLRLLLFALLDLFCGFLHNLKHHPKAETAILHCVAEVTATSATTSAVTQDQHELSEGPHCRDDVETHDSLHGNSQDVDYTRKDALHDAWIASSIEHNIFLAQQSVELHRSTQAMSWGCFDLVGQIFVNFACGEYILERDRETLYRVARLRIDVERTYKFLPRGSMLPQLGTNHLLALRLRINFSCFQA
mmetsp:Transcript_5161/g.9826  ORF Transcript_5161/g.9826 Transcript_5161/m.9826 type:complete len:218 (-) Transcript_5161:315-968(-)